MPFSGRCVNCTISLKNRRIRSRVVLELDTALRDLLISWTSLVEVLPEHRVCEECVTILQFQAQVDEPSRDYGHKSICLGCGVSVLRARSILLNRNREEFPIILQWVPNIQFDLPIFTRICRPCWRRATRAQAAIVASAAEHNVQCDPLEVHVKIEEAYMPLHVDIDVQAIKDPLSPQPLPPFSPFLPVKQEVQPHTPSLLLPNHRRVSSTSGRCIFSDCLNIERLLHIPSFLRQIILIDFNIYVPHCTCICSDHLSNSNWENLNKEYLVNNFTAEQIEDMLFLSKNNPFDLK